MSASLLALLDDIASLLDDVATMTKVAATKTAGVVGDDLAVNAEQVAGVAGDRELAVVWAVAKGSLVNKAILVPFALGVSWLYPPLVTLLLMVGGAFLCFEGFEKLIHPFVHKSSELAKEAAELTDAALDPLVDLVAFEKNKIRGAVRTDFILSAEIIVISLGTMIEEPLLSRIAALSFVALVMTVFVYGVVALIVKLDDLGVVLLRNRFSGLRVLGHILVRGAPWLMKTLTVVGTAAMFVVGGGIVAHGLPGLGHWADASLHFQGSSLLVGAATGLVTGLLAFFAVQLANRLRPRPRS
jgi:uncharacterized protein